MHSFDAVDDEVRTLQEQVHRAEDQLRDLKAQLQTAEHRAKAARLPRQLHRDKLHVESAGDVLTPLEHAGGPIATENSRDGANPDQPTQLYPTWPLVANEYKRYGRQLIMPEIGLRGQLRLKNAKVLVVGLGGLGCPAAAYLAGAGVHTLGLLDGDTVELSNLHRQIAHATPRVGMSKVDSAYEYLQSLNPNVCYNRYGFHLSPERAISIFDQYDLILDCTDHPTSRYLISDACVLTGKSLVSASALRTEGQLIVLNDPPRSPGDMTGGPCYRCIFPKPPPAESVLSCGEGGILGPVVGVMGVLQALEAIKVVTKKAEDNNTVTGNSATEETSPKTSLLMFSAYNNPQFRSVRLRSRRNNCAVCSYVPVITGKSLTSGSLDYVAFCGRTAPINVLPPHSRIIATDLAIALRDGQTNTLIDVRDETQYAICALPGSINVPWTGNTETWLDKARDVGAFAGDGKPQFVVCRFGNDSQLAAQAMIDHSSLPIDVKDLKGGFESWRQEVDLDWPDY